MDHGRRYLGIADEEGYISVVDTTAPLPEDLHLVEEGCVRPRAQWEAHKNAIFDFAWAKARAPASARLWAREQRRASVCLSLEDLIIKIRSCKPKNPPERRGTCGC